MFFELGEQATGIYLPKSVVYLNDYNEENLK